MATLALAVAGAAVGSALLPCRRHHPRRHAHRRGHRLAGRRLRRLARSTTPCSAPPARSRAHARPPPHRAARHRLLAGRADPAPLRPRPHRRPARSGPPTSRRRSVTATHSGGGKGGALGPQSKSIEYRYYASFAVALSEGEIAGIGRVWADGAELDLSTVTYRLYTGSETQAPDSLIEANEGAGNAPAYRGIAYIVFERLALANFGNRIPQLSFEVHRAVDPFEARVRAVTLIPGAGEFVYAPEPVTRKVGAATNVSENVHTRQGGSDWSVALDQLEADAPQRRLRSSHRRLVRHRPARRHCEIRPGVDAADKITEPLVWSVAGLDREDAHLVSLVEGRAAYGGTPSDETVVAAIQDLKARGFSVTLTPFLFMDIPAGNALPDPYTGSTGQPAYPWRGRITVSPAPGQPGTPDKTAAAATQVAAFVGTADVADFAIDGESVVYSGPAEWSLPPLHPALRPPRRGRRRRRRLRHRHRDEGPHHGARQRQHLSLRRRARRSRRRREIGRSASGTKVTYAADWSEYFGHQPADGSGDVYFHLDPLWSSAAIDAVGIDVYWPLADWRDGNAHADRLAGAASIYDLAYLSGNLVAGEGYDWYYASVRRPRGADPHAHHRRRRQALGVPLQGHPLLVAQPALQPPRRRRIRHAHGLGAAVQALLVHGARLPRRRPRRQPAQRLRRPQERRVAACPISRTASATTSCSAATCRPSTTASIPATRATSPAPTRSPPSTAAA